MRWLRRRNFFHFHFYQDKHELKNKYKHKKDLPTSATTTWGCATSSGR